MTECERIIKEGILPKSFFYPETICDFHVDEQRKKIWAIELDLLLQFSKVCKKYGLKYYLIGGTLLGAVRHKGLIPWDDDIDVGMPRSDYEEFLKLNKEFINPYFLQTPYTDPLYAYAYAKLRNSRTTCVPKMFQYHKINHGIGIDIFPYDNWIMEGGRERFKKIHNLCLENSTYMRMTNPNLDDANKVRVNNWCGRNHVEVYEEIQELASAFKDVKTDRVAKVVFAYSYEKDLYYAEDFAETVLMDFCGFKFPIPKGYDRILKGFFGDYMQFPPIDQRNGGHDGAIFDPDISFDDYLQTININSK